MAVSPHHNNKSTIYKNGLHKRQASYRHVQRILTSKQSQNFTTGLEGLLKVPEQGLKPLLTTIPSELLRVSNIFSIIVGSMLLMSPLSTTDRAANNP
jgi:hypothetical protein